MKRFSDLWHRSPLSRHSRTLETEAACKSAEIDRQREEIALLRAENRALLNSILGIAGMKPLPPLPIAGTTSFTTPPAPAGHSGSPPPPSAADDSLSTPTSSNLSARQAGSPTGVPSASSPRQSGTRNGSSRHSSDSSPRLIHAPPHRRRSWHQINRLLEFQSARKEDT